MPNRTTWIQSQVAPDKEALAAGDGCHKDEAKCLNDYLGGKMTVQEAAKAIISPVLQETDPSAEVYRLNAFLCEALVELEDDRENLFQLLEMIQSQPSAGSIDWSQLQGFGHMWSDLYGLHLHEPSEWERARSPLPVDKRASLCHEFEAIGTVEATLFMRGIGGVSADWGYETLNMVCLGRPGLEVFIYKAHAWLRVAGVRLVQSQRPEQLKSWSQLVQGRHGKVEAVGTPMAEHWQRWKRSIKEMSEVDGLLSNESREIAAECHKLME
ncbi:hypothetical protein B0J13DRAFT_550449 [Dactylonectria estremocensis]|uniref:Uncharacterized protein n=1 Tax=Dactylonectria estremocensis TaxID=1079267 RepID=A0A9P9EYT6_9HYPO|nr:hypothetical protein B0J13DRAFT_550449 [Dactylonectria estremocensis]